MHHKMLFTLVSFILFITAANPIFSQTDKIADERFVSCIVDLKTQHIEYYWKDDKQRNFKSIGNLKTWLDKNHRSLVFAMNGGMYKPDHSPLGLFIEKGKTITPLDTASGNGNFYLKPNGVLCITDDRIAIITSTAKFKASKKIKFATQSGPMLLIGGHIHPAFDEGSTNLNIRNGVGVLPDNKLLFAMSKKEINFYDFACFFKKAGCKNALYLDGVVSRAFLPKAGWEQLDGNFGVIIGVTEPKK